MGDDITLQKLVFLNTVNLIIKLEKNYRYNKLNPDKIKLYLSESAELAYQGAIKIANRFDNKVTSDMKILALLIQQC